MAITMYQVDAFASNIFEGNPAAVCPLSEWIDDALMQSIAKENNLSETVFFVEKGEVFEIRWFMPYAEIDLCGHATLAAAYIINRFIKPELNKIKFTSKSGVLSAFVDNNSLITLDFPRREPTKVVMPDAALKSFNYEPIEALANGRDLLLVFEKEEQIALLEFKLSELKKLPYLCIVATAIGDNSDFVSRVFDPKAIPVEDPVTGSVHTSLVPYWANKLGKIELEAKQLSERGGELCCTLKNDRVLLRGMAVLFLKGEIYIN